MTSILPRGDSSPLGAPSAPLPAGTKAGASLAPAALRVLVVADDPVDRLLVRRALDRSGAGMTLDEAASTMDAAECLTRAPYDCVLMDYNLPGNDGLSVLRGMKREYRELPVILLTALGDEEVAVELMKAGAADSLPKLGLTPMRLAQSIRGAVDLARAESDARRAVEALRQSSERTTRLQQITARLASALTASDVASLCVSGIREAVGATTVWMAKLDESESFLVSLAHAGYGETDAAPYERIAIDAPLAATDVLHTGEARYYASSEAMQADLPALGEVVQRIEQEALVVLPLDAGRGTFGILALGFVERRDFDADAREFLRDLACQCARAVERADLYESERRARADAERLAARLAGAARAIMRQPTLQEVLDEIARQSRDVIGAHRATVTVASGPRAAQATAVAYSEAHAAWRDFADAPPPRDRLLTPLLGGDGVPLGTIEVIDKIEGAFNSADESILDQLGELAAAAVENVRLRERAEAARRDAEAANRAKSEFLARMSHDLRTPLNAIGGHTSLLQLGVHGPLSADQRTALERVKLAQQHLLVLINDILSFARLEAGQVRITPSDVAVGPLVQELAELVRPEAEARGLTLVVRGAASDVLVRADRERLVQVLLNLTSNALKFTQRGGVEITTDVQDDYVDINVRDTGIGIPETRLASIFEPFVQARGNVSERQAGVGLGLAISRELTEKMGGMLQVDSVEGEGSTFTARLERVTGR